MKTKDKVDILNQYDNTIVNADSLIVNTRAKNINKVLGESWWDCTYENKKIVNFTVFPKDHRSANVTPT